MRHWVLKFRPEGGNEGGSGSDKGGAGGAGGAGGQATQQKPGEREVVIVHADVERLVARYGTKDRAIQVLYRDAHRARARARTAEEKLGKVEKEGATPAGGMVLTAEQKSQWDAFVKLGKKPEELATIVTQHGELQGKVQKGERENAARSAAKLLGWNEKAFVTVAAKENLDLVVKKETVDGKEVEVPYVQPKEQGATPVRLADYAKDAQRFDPIYLPALKTQDASAEATDGARSTTWFEQSSSTQSETKTDKSTPVGPAFIREKRVLPSQRNTKA